MQKVFLQCLLLIAVPVMILVFKLQNTVYAFLSFMGFDSNSAKRFLNSLPFGENGISLMSGFAISLLILWFLRKANKEKVFSTGNNYRYQSYILYYIASKILGYRAVTLVRVPIHLQFHLIINELFENVRTDENTQEVPQAVTVLKKNMDQKSKVINLVLNDTYEILREQIPHLQRNLPTITIMNGMEFNGVRTYNPDFLTEIRKQTHEASQSHSIINVFATTNTQHNKVIIEDCFKNAQRTGFKSLNVFQFDTTSKTFDDKHVIY